MHAAPRPPRRSLSRRVDGASSPPKLLGRVTSIPSCDGAVQRDDIHCTMVAPLVTLTHLNRADGSATYTHNGYSIIGAVNGPIEVQRRDELPEEAAIEVNVRPAMGVGSAY